MCGLYYDEDFCAHGFIPGTGCPWCIDDEDGWDDDMGDPAPYNTCTGDHTFGKCDRDSCDFVRLA